MVLRVSFCNSKRYCYQITTFLRIMSADSYQRRNEEIRELQQSASNVLEMQSDTANLDLILTEVDVSAGSAAGDHSHGGLAVIVEPHVAV